MLRRVVITSAITALFAAPAAQAQRAESAFHITPYAGYLKLGSFVDGPLGTSLGAAGGAMYGGQLGVRITDNVSLIGNVAYSRSDLQVGVPLIGGLNVGNASVWMYDGGVQLSLPASTRSLPFAPFVQGGVGALRHDVEVSRVRSNATNLAWNVGAGVDLPVASNIGLRVMAKDYIGKLDVKEATGLSYEPKTTHNWALTAGLRIGF